MNATVRTTARWIELCSWGFVVLGVTLPLAFASAPFALYREALADWAFGSVTVPAADRELLGLLLGITGGSIAGKWVVHALLARGPLAEGRPWARDLTMRGIALWFVVDSLASLRLGATFNVWMINLLPLGLVGVPIFLTYGRFEADPAPARSTPATKACLWTSVAGAATGLAIAFGGTSLLFGLWWQGLERSLYGGAALGDAPRNLALFFFGPIGGCTLAQFAMLAGLVRHEGATLRVASIGAASILVWFLVDSACGLAHGGLFNIVLVNVPCVVLTLPPWLWLALHLSREDT
jgi:hypothetical protein